MAEAKQVTTGGAAGSDQAGATTTIERDLNSTGAFAEVSPSAQVTGAATLTNVFPDDPTQFQTIQTEYFTEHQAKVDALHTQYGYGTDFSDPSKSTKEIMDQSGPGHTESALMTPEGSTTAYTSSNVEDTMVAFEESEGTDEEYYYGETEGTVSQDVETEETSGSSSSDIKKE